MDKLIQKTDLYCLKLEEKCGLMIASFLLGLLILTFDMIYITPHFEAAYHGLQYSILSNNPFDFSFSNSLRYRILPPFLGYITMLRGKLFFIVPLIFAFLFVSSVYQTYRKKDYTPTDALLFTGFIAFSCTIFIQLSAPGYTDAVFYFFIFLAFQQIQNIVLSALYFSLALLTHESSFFLLPGLLLYAGYSKNQGVHLVKYFLAYGIAIIPPLIYRYWVSSHVEVIYSASFYLTKQNISSTLRMILPLIPGGLFYVFKLFWFFPVYVLYKSWGNREFKFFIVILSILICNLLQLAIAYDVTRMLCLGFPAILLAAEKVKTYWLPRDFTRFALGLTLLNFLILQYCMSSGGLSPMLPAPYTYLTHLIQP